MICTVRSILTLCDIFVGSILLVVITTCGIVSLTKSGELTRGGIRGVCIHCAGVSFTVQIMFTIVTPWQLNTMGNLQEVVKRWRVFTVENLIWQNLGPGGIAAEFRGRVRVNEQVWRSFERAAVEDLGNECRLHRSRTAKSSKPK